MRTRGDHGRNSKSAALSLLLGFVGMAIFGGTLPATRIAVSAIDPMALTALRTAIAGLCSLVLLLILRRPLPPRSLWPQLERDEFRLMRILRFRNSWRIALV
jgi:drug/metabolite transporter (DMT)-like permease